MDNSNQRPANMMKGPSGRPPQGPRPPMPPAAGAMAMTPKEIVGILRRHIWMILIFTILGTIIGGGAWFLCDRYLPRYTSKRAIDVDPPINLDPRVITGSQPQKDIYYQFRFTKATLVKQQSMLEELLRRDKVRDTDWFKRYAKVDSAGRLIGDQDKAVNKAYEELEDNLGASAPRDNNYILVSMRCAKAKEAKLIVDEMVDVFLTQQRNLAQSGLKEDLAQFTKQRDEIQRTLDQIENELESIRSGTTFARLNLGEGQSFRDYMDQRLADLENQFSELNSEKGRLEGEIAILKARAEAPDFDDRVQEQVQNDPTSRLLRDRIALLEPELERLRNRFGEDHRTVQQSQAALNEYWDAYAKRQREIGNILRQSNLLGAQEDMVAIVRQLETTQKQLQAAYAEYKAIDDIRSAYAISERKRIETTDLLEEMNTAIEKKKAQIDDPKISKLYSTSSATLPRQKSFPNPIMFFPGGFILGMLAGLGLAFMVELMNDLLRTPSDVM
ncbi:MAG: GumC family protein, partial [Planctomycetota bacterium]